MLSNCFGFRRRKAQQFGSDFLDIVVGNIGIILTTQWSHNWYGQPLAGLLRERRLVEVLLQEDWEKVPSWESTATLSFSLRRRHQIMAGKKQLSPDVIQSEENIDFEDPTPLIDQVCSGCTQRESETTESNVKSKSDLFAMITMTDTEVMSNQKTWRNEQLYRGVTTRRAMQKNA